jgi:hypothetical protein
MDESRTENQPNTPAMAPVPLALNEGLVPHLYANYCRVVPMPEEIMLEFGMNSEQVGPNGLPAVHLTHRVICNPFTAKRLLIVLQRAVMQHEKAFGNLEIDVTKRLTPTK